MVVVYGVCTGIAPNAPAYKACIIACEKGTQWSRALELFDQMIRDNLTPDTVSNATVAPTRDTCRSVPHAIESARQVAIRHHHVHLRTLSYDRIPCISVFNEVADFDADAAAVSDAATADADAEAVHLRCVCTHVVS